MVDCKKQAMRWGWLWIFLGVSGAWGEAPWEITIQAKHVNAARAIADALFSYHERHDLSEQQACTEDFKISFNPESITNTVKLADHFLPKSKEPIVEAQKRLRVGVPDYNLPFCEQRGHEFAGFEVEVVRLLAQDGAFSCDFVTIPVNEVEQQLKERTVDIVLGWNWRSENENNYTDGILGTDLGTVFLKSKNSAKKLNFSGKKIGVLRDSCAETFIRSAQIQDARIVLYGDLKTLRQSILQESETVLDYALIDHLTAQDWLAQDPRLVYTSLGINKELAFRILPDSPWKKLLNEVIQHVILTPKFRELREQWSFNL